MLKPAIMYESYLNNKLHDVWYDEKYKYYFGVFFSNLNLPKDDFSFHNFVSLNNNDEVIGYITYEIDRSANNVNNLGVINFSNNKYDKITFGIDIRKVIDNIFVKFGFNKISFSVVIGNPIEKSYDKLIKKYNGRIVGIKKDHVKLFDNKLYDLKMYEIFASDYFNSKHLISK